MIRIETVVGNLHDGYVLPSELTEDTLWLSRWDAQKRRLRKRSAHGRDLALALVQAGELRDGDVLALDGSAAVVARIEAGEVLVFTLAEVEGEGAPALAATAVRALRLGHVLGNQHWPMQIVHHDTAGGGPGSLEVIVPLSVDRRVVDAVVRAHRLEGVAFHFRPASPGEARLHATSAHDHADDHAYTSGAGAIHAHGGSPHAH